MKTDIIQCKELGVQGIVFGCLTDEDQVDTALCKELLNLWNGAATFHRAIDDCVDITKACQTIIELGFERILSSGGCSKATDGLDVLRDLQSNFGDQIIIMPGSGVTTDNAVKILKHTGCSEIHATCKINEQTTSGISNGLFTSRTLTSEDLVRALKLKIS